MSPTNEELAQRCSFLMTGINICNSNIQQMNTEFKDQAKDTVDAIDKALHAHGYKTMQDFVNEVANQLPEKERKQFLTLIEQNRLPTTWESIIGREPAESIVKITEFVGSLYGLNAVFQIKAGLSFDMRLGFSYVTAFSRVSALRLAATEAVAKHLSKLNNIAALEDEIILNDMLEGNAKELRAQLQVALNEEVSLAGEVSSLRKVALEAEVPAAEAEAAVLTARSTARASLRTGVYGALIGAGLMLGAFAYSKYKEKKDAEHLKDAIGMLAASRLYAQVSYRHASVFHGLMVDVEHIGNDYAEIKKATTDADRKTATDNYQHSLNQLVHDMEKKLNKQVEADILKKAYEEVNAQDKNAAPPTYTGDDPKTIEDLTKIHEKQMKEYLDHPPTRASK